MWPKVRQEEAGKAIAAAKSRATRASNEANPHRPSRLTRKQQVASMLFVFLMITFVLMTLLPIGDSKIIKIRKKKIKYAAQAASALFLLGKPKKLVFPLPLPVPLPIPIITKHDPVIHPIDPLQYLAFEKGLALSGLGGLPGGFSTYGKRK